MQLGESRIDSIAMGPNTVGQSPREQIRSREAAFQARRMGDQMLLSLSTSSFSFVDKRWNVFIENNWCIIQ